VVLPEAGAAASGHGGHAGENPRQPCRIVSGGSRDDYRQTVRGGLRTAGVALGDESLGDVRRHVAVALGSLLHLPGAEALGSGHAGDGEGLHPAGLLHGAQAMPHADMGYLVGQHAGQLVLVADLVQEASGDEDGAARAGHGVDLA